MVMTGVTTSSLSLLHVALHYSSANMIGQPLPIRSDEWLTETPIELATLAHGASMTSPLAHGPDLIYQVSSGSPLESILFLEGNLLRLGEWLPDAMLFAAFRAYPWLLLALFLPPLLRRFGANRPMSWLAVVLCFLAPSSVWWSFMPIRILGLTAAGCYFLILAKERFDRRHWTRGLVLAALSGLLLARLVTYYVPWCVVVGVPLVLATGLYLIYQRDGRRRALAAIGVGATVALILLIGLFWENWAALQAELSTVYPGQRRVTGRAVPPSWIFGGPGLFDLDSDPTLVGTNQSEITSAYLVCGLVALLLWPAVRHRIPGRAKAAVAGLAVPTAVFAAWIMFDWGPVGEHIPGLDVILPVRAAQTVGIPATILMCLVLSIWAREDAVTRESARADARRRRSRALSIAAVAAVVTGYSVGYLHALIPSLPAWQMWLATAATTALVWAFVRYPGHWAPVVLALVVSLAAYADANPITFGLGQIRTSHAADRARAFAASDLANGTVMVTDSTAANALLVANGVPLLSGYQVTGPVRKEWQVVDPTGQYEKSWDRGASYLLFAFDEPRGHAPVVENPHNDVIQVHTDPCWLASSPFHVSRIVSAVPVASRCVRRDGTFTWNGAKQHVYRLQAG